MVHGRIGKDFAVSEVIGAILLIALVVTAVAIITAGVLSGPLPEAVPKLTIVAGPNLTNPAMAYLYHDGGDPLRADQFIIQINDPPIPVAINVPSPVRSAVIRENGVTETIWSVGRVVEITNSAPITAVQVIYHGNGGDVLLFRTNFVPPTATTSPTATSTTTVTATTTATTTVTATGTTTATTTATTSPTSTTTTPSGCGCFSSVDFSAVNIGSLNVKFEDLFVPAADICHWNFGDGGTSDKCKETYKYAHAGTYLVTLTAGRTGCAGTCSITKPVAVT